MLQSLFVQLDTLIYLSTMFGVVVAGLVVGTLIKRWWLSLPYCVRCWHGRVMPGDQLCLACKMELH